MGNVMGQRSSVAVMMLLSGVAACGGGGSSGAPGQSEAGGSSSGGSSSGGASTGGASLAGGSQAHAGSAGTSGTPGSAGSDPDSPCTLRDAGPVTVTAPNQVIENLRISADGVPGITIDGFDQVVIRNVEIRHSGAQGIKFTDAHQLTIDSVSITNVGAPAQGANSSIDESNIEGKNSNAPSIQRARLSRGSSGVYLLKCQDARLSFIEGYDFRGPMPRGQLVQFNQSDRALLEDFSAVNPPDSSWVEDNVSVYDSDDCVVRRGLLDGNNSPSGVGVMVEFDHAGDNGLVQDVDAVRMGNGCFFGYPAVNLTYERTRCRDNLCVDQGRGAPKSGGLGWGAGEDAQVAVVASGYFNLCAGVSWANKGGGASFTTLELEEQDFVPRAPIALSFCWEQ